jgi:hypothetical protein
MTDAVTTEGYSSAAKGPTRAGADAWLLDPTFARNVMLVLLANLTMVCVLAVAIALTWTHRRRATAWVLMLVALVVSRQLLFLSTGIVFGVRDAGTHIFGQTLGILQTSQIPTGSSYSFYPVIHVLLATVQLFTGMDLWNAASVLATLLCIASALFVVLTACRLRPGSELLVGALFVAAPNAAALGSLYQPMTMTILVFAAQAFLVARQDDLPFRRTLFLALGVLLTLTHPYSAATINLALLLMAMADWTLNRRSTFLLPAVASFALTFLYSGFIAGDFKFFVSLFQFNIFSPGTTPEGSGTVFRPPRPTPPTAAYRIVNDIALLGVIVPGIVGWAMTLRERRGRPASHHLLAASLGLLFGLGLLFAAVLQSRVVALAAIVLALFAAWAYARFPAPARYSILPLVLLCSITSAAATTSYFPWSDGDQAPQPLRNQGEMGSLIGFFHERLWPDYGQATMPKTVSCDIVFYRDNTLQIYPFTTAQAPGTPYAAYLLFQPSDDQFGCSKVAEGGTLDAKIYTPYPTPEQHRLLVLTDRIAQFGDVEVYQA